MAPPPATRAAPWLAADAARPLLAWPTEQLDALAAALAGALGQWREAWGIAGAAPRLRCEPATTAFVLQDGWQALSDAPAATWLHEPAGSQARMAGVLFDASFSVGPVATDVARACIHDAKQRLRTALGCGGDAPVRSSPPPDLGQAWSGAVQASLPCTPGWSLLLGPDAVRAWCHATGVAAKLSTPPATRESLCKLGEALAAHTLALNVSLTGCELELGTLQGLRVGDVVRLGHEFHAPATLRDADGRAVFDGYLVAQQGRKAIELAKPQLSRHR